MSIAPATREDLCAARESHTSVAERLERSVAAGRAAGGGDTALEPLGAAAGLAQQGVTRRAEILAQGG